MKERGWCSCRGKPIGKWDRTDDTDPDPHTQKTDKSYRRRIGLVREGDTVQEMEFET